MYPLLFVVVFSALVPYIVSAQPMVERWRIPSVQRWYAQQYYLPTYLPDRRMIVYGAPSYCDDIMYVDANAGIRSIKGHVVDYRHLADEDGLYALLLDGTVQYVDDATQVARRIGRVPVGSQLLGVDEASRIVICRKYPILYLVYDDGQSRVKEIRLEEPYGDDRIFLMDAGATVLRVQGFGRYDTSAAQRVVRYDVESGLVISDVAIPTTMQMQMISKRTIHVRDSTYMDLTNGTFLTRNGGTVYPFVMDTIHVSTRYSVSMDTLIVSLNVDTARSPSTVYRLPVQRQYQEIYPRGGYFHVVAGDRYWTIDVAGMSIVDSGRNDVPLTFERNPFAVSRDGAIGLYVEHSLERGDKLFVVDRTRRRVVDSIPGVFMPRSNAFHVEGDSIVAWYETAAIGMARRTLRNDRVVRSFGRNNLWFRRYLGDGRSLCSIDSMGTYAIVPAGDAPVQCPPLKTFSLGGAQMDKPVMLDPEGMQLHLTATGYMNVDISTQATSAHRSYKDLILSMRRDYWQVQVVGTGGDTLVALTPGGTRSHVRIIGPDGIDSVDIGRVVGNMMVWDNRTPRAVVLASMTDTELIVVDAVARKSYPVSPVARIWSFRACEDGSGLMIEYAYGDSLMLYDFRNDTILWKGERPFDAQYTAPDASAVIVAQRSQDTVHMRRYPHEGPPVEICEPVPVPTLARFTVSGFADAIVWHDRDTIHRMDIADRSVVSHRMEMPFPNGEVPAISTDRHGRTAFFMHRGSVGLDIGKYEFYIGALNFSDGRGYLIPSVFNMGTPEVVKASPDPIYYDRYMESIMIDGNGRITGCYPTYTMAQMENRNILCGGWVGLPPVGMSEFAVGTLSWSGQEYPKRLVDIVDYGGVPVAIGRNRSAVFAVEKESPKIGYYYRASPDAEALFLGTEYVSSSPSLDYVFARRGDSILCYRTRDGKVLYGCPYHAFGTVKQWTDDHSAVVVRNTDVRMLDLDPDATFVAEQSRSESDVRGTTTSERAFDVLGREVDIDASGPKIIVRTDASGRNSTRKIYTP